MHELRPVMVKIRQDIDNIHQSGSNAHTSTVTCIFPRFSSKQRRCHITSYELRRNGRAYLKSLLPGLCKWLTYHLRQADVIGHHERVTQIANHGLVSKYSC
jgi:hypothetical protein